MLCKIEVWLGREEMMSGRGRSGVARWGVASDHVGIAGDVERERERTGGDWQ